MDVNSHCSFSGGPLHCRNSLLSNKGFNKTFKPKCADIHLLPIRLMVCLKLSAWVRCCCWSCVSLQRAKRPCLSMKESGKAAQVVHRVPKVKNENISGCSSACHPKFGLVLYQGVLGPNSHSGLKCWVVDLPMWKTLLCVSSVITWVFSKLSVFP